MTLPVRFHILLALLFMHYLCVGQPDVSDQDCAQEIRVSNSSSCQVSIYIQLLDSSLELELFGTLEAGEERLIPVEVADVFIYAVNNLNQQVAGALSLNCESMDLAIASCFVESSSYFDCENLQIRSRRNNTSPRPVGSTSFASCGDEFEFQVDSDEPGLVLWTTPSNDKSLTMDDHFLLVSSQLDESMAGIYTLEWFGFDGCYERTEIMLEIANCCSLRNELPQDTIICRGESLVINSTLSEMNVCTEEINGFVDRLVRSEGNVSDLGMFQGEADGFGPQLLREETNRETFLLLDFGELIPDESEICFVLRQGRCVGEFNSSNFVLSAGVSTFSLRSSEQFLDETLLSSFEEYCITTTEQTRFVRIEDLGNGCGIRVDAVKWRNNVSFNELEYQWSTGETTESIEVNRSGIYGLQVTDCSGCKAYNEVIVEVDECVVVVDPPPCEESFSSPVTSPDTFRTCFGESDLTGNVASNDSDPDGFELQYELLTEAINGEVNMSSDGNFSYSPNAQFSGIDQFQYRVCKQDFEPCDDANFQFQCSAGFVTIELSVNQFSFQERQIRACEGESVVLNVPDNFGVLWSTGQTEQTISVNRSGIFTATVTDVNGCIVADEIEVILNQAPEVNVTKSNDIDCVANLSILSASGGDSYVWSTGQTEQTISVNQPGVYQVTARSNQGCTSTASVQVNNNIIGVSAAISGSRNVCSTDEPVVLSAFGGDSYQWSTGEANQSVTVVGPGIYEVTATDNETGCSATTSLEIDLIPVIADAGENVVVCPGETVVIGASQVGPTNATFTWNNGASGIINSNSSGRITVSPSQTQTFTLQVINNGCLAEDQVTVFVEDFSFDVSNNQTICQGESVVLRASGAASYLWNTGETTAEITVAPDQFQTYSVIGTNQVGCSSERFVSIDISEPINSSITPDQVICPNETITIGASGGSVYQWSNGAIGSSISVSPDVSTNFVVTITNGFGCQTTESVNVNIQAVNPVNLGPDQQVCSGMSVTLVAPAADTYLWSTGQITQQINVIPEESQSYSVTISQGTCTSSDEVFIEAIRCLGNISGFALDDLNEGIENSVISLFDSGRNLITRTTSNGDGLYEFNSIDPGRYILEQDDIAGFINLSDFDESPDDAEDVDGVNNIILVTLQSGENDEDNIFRDQIVNSTISGFAFDGNGAGLVNIRISLFDITGNLLSSTLTNGNGFYQFNSLPAGNYIVEQENVPGFTNLSDQDESPEVASDVGDFDEVNNQIFVSVGPRENDTDNNFRDEIANGSILGSAFDEAGNGLANIVITLTDLDGNSVSSVATGADGSYQFRDVTPGDYSLEQVDIPGFLNLSDFDESPDDLNDAVDEADNIINVTVEAFENDADNNFRDQLLTGAISGQALDDQGRGLVGIPISLFSASDGNLVATRITLGTGGYEFTGLLPGDYIIEQADIPGFENISDFDETPDDLNDAIDEADNIIFATVQPQEIDSGNFFRDQTVNGAILGAAFDENGNGLANIVITLTDLVGNSIFSVATDNNGFYQFGSVAPGDYIIEQVDIPGFSNISDFDESPDDLNDNTDGANNMIFVTVEPFENDIDNNFRDRLLRGTISGFALDDQGNGLENVTISLFTVENRNLLARRFTDDTGFYEFASLQPGNYTIEQNDIAGFESISDEDESPDDLNDANDGVNNVIFATVEAQENDADNNFRDRTITGTISGFAFDESENGIANIVITLRDINGNSVSSEATDEFGSYEFSNIAPGEYVLEQVDIPNYTNLSDFDESPDDVNDGIDEADNLIFVTVEPLENDEDNIFRDQLVTGTLSGFALDQRGNGLVGVTISLFTVENRNLLARRFTDGSGFYEFASLQPGDYTIEQNDIEGFLNISDFDESPDDLNDGDDGANNVIFATVEPLENDEDNIFRDQIISGSISGFSLIDEDDDGDGDIPFTGTSIFLLDANGNQIQSTVVDDNGRYIFEGLNIGEYTVLEEVVEGYGDVLDEDQAGDASDQDGFNDPINNRIPVVLTANENDTGNNFVNRLLISRISGFVRLDVDDDGVVDIPIEDVPILLFDARATRIARTLTDENGFYEFVGFEAGEYSLFEDQEEGVYEDLSDVDESINEIDMDGFDSPRPNNQIVVTLDEGEHDADNNFNNFIPNVGTISGFVLLDSNDDDIGDQGIEGVLVSLFDLQNELVSTRRTINNGSFEFTDIPPGDYYLSESDLVGFDDVSDFDNTDPDDPNDVDGVNDIINVSIVQDEVDDGNIFVNRRSQSDIIETCRQAQFDDFSLGFGDFWRSGGNRANFSEDGIFLSAPGSIVINDDRAESLIFSSSQNFGSVNSLRININYLVQRAEGTDHFVFEVSSNGGATFTEVRRWQVIVDFLNDEWNFTSVSIPADLLSSNTVLRIRSELNAPTENLYLDDIEIEICFDEVDDDDDGVALTSDTSENQTVDKGVTQEVETRSHRTKSNDYKVFPNPTSNFLNIQLPTYSEENIQISIFDSTGKRVFNSQMQSNQSQIRLDVQHLDSDQLYFIQLHNDDKEVQMLRFLKIN